jgi:hypothetical protein
MAKKQVVADVTISVAELTAENTTARTSGRGRRSQLYLWLRAHHDQLAEAFSQTGPAWSQIATSLGNNGVVDGAGKEPTPETVRATWYRVRRDVAAARARRAGPSPEGPAASVAFISSTPARSAASLSLVGPTAGDPAPPHRTFGLAQPRGHRPSAPPVPESLAEPERVRRSPEEVERIMSDMMSGAPNNPFRHDKGD